MFRFSCDNKIRKCSTLKLKISLFLVHVHSREFKLSFIIILKLGFIMIIATGCLFEAFKFVAMISLTQFWITLLLLVVNLEVMWWGVVVIASKSFNQRRNQEGLDPLRKKIEPQREHGSNFFGRGPDPPGYTHAFNK